MSKLDLYLAKNGIQHKHHKYTKTSDMPFIEYDCSEETCDCDLYAFIKSVKKEYISRRREGDKVRTMENMYFHICCQIDSDWRIVDHILVKKEGVNVNNEVYMAIKSLKRPNFMNIRPYFVTRRQLKSSELPLRFEIPLMYKLFDVYYFTKVLREKVTAHDFEPVWMSIKSGGSYRIGLDGKLGVPWDDNSSQSLKVLAMRKCSLFNHVYGGYKNMPNTTYTMNNLHLKILPAVQKLMKDTHSMYGYGKFVASMTHEVIALMCKMLKVEEFKNSQTWTLEKMIANIRKMPHASSVGLRPEGKYAGNDGSGRRQFTRDGVKYRVMVGGKKAYHFDYVEKEIRRMAREVREGKEPVFNDRAWALMPKNEILAARTMVELIKFFAKLRLFNICAILLSALQRGVHYHRQNIERGSHIAIGISYWHGGADDIAKSMHAGRGTHTYYTGDFNALDTSIKAHLLMVYSYFTLYYYNKGGDYDILLAFMKIVADNLTLKVVHVYEDVWKLIYGGMPSGAYETSHGDSWIVMFVLVMYCLEVGKKRPALMSVIKKMLIDREIMFYIYGDDTILAVPNNIKEYINIYGFAQFAKEYFQMEMRDLVEIKSFESIPDPVGGGIKEQGVTFLSKYFVRRQSVTDRVDVPEYLPYRDIMKIVKKYPFGDGSVRSPLDYIFAAIGMAYDSYGTNTRAYEFCHYMYYQHMEMVGTTDVNEVIELYADRYEGKSINTLIKKCGIDMEVLKRGFPTRDQLLDMHKPEKYKRLMRNEDYDMDSFLYN